VHTVVGRDDELQAIASWLETPGSRTLLIAGEAGIGKTTLWRAGVELAREHGYRVVSSAPALSETQLSFTALRDLLDGEFDEVADELTPPQRHVLSVILLREEPTGAAIEPGAIAVSVLSALRALGSHMPTIVALDDVQWLDTASAAAIEYALRRLGSDPIGALLAQRSQDGEPAPIVGSLGDDLEILSLEPLTMGALGRVLHERLGTALPRPTLHRLQEISDGNPFFALELARALEGRATALRPGDPLPVPSTQRDLLRRRLEDLPPQTLDALAFASALSRPTVSLVGTAVGRDPGMALDDAARADIARTEGEDVRFAHPLFAAAMYELVASRRTELHARLATIVPDPEERALHLAVATADPDEAVAETIEEGARVAFARGSPEAAAELTEAALRLTQPTDKLERGRRAMEAGWLMFTAGDPARARALLTEAIQTAPHGDVRADAVVRLAWLDHHTRDRRAALADLEDSLESDEGTPLVKAEAHLLVAVSHWVLREDIALAAQHAREAVGLSEDLDERSLLVSALAALAMSEFTMGGGLPNAALDRALGIHAEASDGRVLRQPLQHQAAMLLHADRFEEARPILRRGQDLAEAHGDASFLPWPLMRLAQLELLAGNWMLAEAHAEAGVEVALQTGQRPLQADLQCTQALVLAHRGQVEGARAAADEGLRLAESSGAGIGLWLAHWALGLLDLSLDDAEGASVRLEALRAKSESAAIVDPGENRYLGDLGEALTRLGRTAEADVLADGLEALGRSLERHSAVAVAFRLRGLAALERGETGAALEALDRALVCHDLVPIPFDRARTLLALGSAQRRDRQRKAARETLEGAVSMFEQLGAELWAARARAELGRIGGRARSAGGLTPTEQRVAALVARGKSNKEVASELVVSVHTVEAALTSVYRKLDVRSRTEMAAKLADAT